MPKDTKIVLWGDICKMKFLAFYIGGHDSNISMADDSGQVSYYKIERIVQSKHKKGSLAWVRSLCDDVGFCPDAVCYSDGDRNGLGSCTIGQLAKEVTPLSGLYDVPTYCLDHHYSHVLSAWPILEGSGREEEIGVCIDGRGDNEVKCSIIESPFRVGTAKLVHYDQDACFCLLLNQIGRMMGLCGGDLDFAGKIMGAYAYGHIDDLYVKQCCEFIASHRIVDLFDVPFHGDSISELCRRKGDCFFDWLASFQSLVGSLVGALFSRFVPLGTRVVYAGGCAQNTVYNEMLNKKYDIVIPPHCYDGGMSLGCLEYLSLLYGAPLRIDGFPFLQTGEDVGYASIDTINKVCDCLCNGKIVGWCQGLGEIGPRALGHRSILMNPSVKNCKSILNSRIKKREFWRPFAGSLLVEDGPLVMTSYHACPYMLHAVDVAPQWHSRLTGIVHADGTCRFQTVGNEYELRSFRCLIDEFKTRTGIPALLNTSYNMSGKPIVNTRQDIVNAFDSLDLDVLCVGDNLLEKGRQ